MIGETLLDDARTRDTADARDGSGSRSSSAGNADRPSDDRSARTRRLLVSRVAVAMTASGLAGAIAAAVVFTGLWMTTALPLGPSDRVIELFTSAPPLSVEALRGGLIVAALLGFFVGVVSGAIYELSRAWS